MAARGSAPARPADQQRRAKVEAMRAAQQRTARRRRIVLVGVVAVVAAAAVVITMLSMRAARPATTAAPTVVAATGTALPPWPAPADPQSGMQAAGLVSNPMEGAVQHFHAHLDILVDGQPVVVPANLGIDEQRQLIAELHTHDDTGILHVESGSPSLKFTLGQFFTEWGVRLDTGDLGGLHAGGGKQLTAYVNGQLVTGDPGQIQLANHQEIVLAYGSGAPSSVPTSYDFAAHGL